MSIPSFFLRFFWKRIGGASVILAFFYFLSRLIGLLRDRVLASHFGAGNLLDAYYVAFNIPDFIFNLLVVGAVSSAFIPVFIEYQSRHGGWTSKVWPSRESAGQEWELASNFLNILLAAVAVMAALMFVLAPFIINLIAPGFASEKKDLAVLFTRVMLFSPLIFCASSVMGSVLQAFDRFLAYAAAPVFYNVGIIFGALVLEPAFGPLGLAEGVVLGAGLHFLIQWLAVRRLGFRWQAVWHWGDETVKKIIRLSLPRTIGLAANQINFIVLNALATTLGLGAVTIFNFANNLQYLPVALVGISVAVAAFPTFSRQALSEDKKILTAEISRQIRRIMFLVVPFAVLLFFLRGEITRFILKAGDFSLTDADLTARVLAFFLVGAIGHSLMPVLARSFYSVQDTKTPVIISLTAIAANIIMAFGFLKSGTGLAGLALAFSLANILNAVLLFAFFKKKVGDFRLTPLIFCLLKLLAASALMWGLLWGISSTGFLGGEGTLNDFARLAVYGTVGLLTFLLFSAILKAKFFDK